jgi:hypothetical protein
MEKQSKNSDQNKNSDQKDASKAGAPESKDKAKEDSKAKNETQTNTVELMKKGDYMVHVFLIFIKDSSRRSKKSTREGSGFFSSTGSKN